jgi:hypothetical protein
MSKIMLGIVLTLMIFSMVAAPALAKDHDNKGEDDDRYEHHRGRWHEHERGYYCNPNEYGWADNRPYGYSYGHRERAYAHSPVIYEPPQTTVIYTPSQPPGISIFFPPIIIHP